MAYQALYRTFRPATLSGLVRQEHIVKILVNQIETDRVGHAYLFCGPRGTGKTSTAKIFARAINCEHPVDGSPCGECGTCRALSDPANLDITEIDAASNNGVSEMRDLREKVQYPPVAARYKVYIVDEVHMLSDSAFNALLKTLEEPPKHAVFILATTEPQKLPATILSRCMRFDFKLIPQKDLEEHLKRILREIGKEYEEEAVSVIARAGAGSVRDMLSIADICVSYSRGTLTYADVNEVLGAADFDEIAKLSEAILTENVSDALTKTEQLLSSGKGVGVLTKDLLQCINYCSVAGSCRNANGILNLPAEMFAQISRIAAAADGRKILRAAEIFTGIEADLRYSLSPRIVFETALVKACLPAADLDELSIARRLDALEEKLRGGAVSASPAREARAPALEEAPFEEAPFDEPPPEPVAPPARRAAERVDALSPDKRKGAFGYFMRALRANAKNGVLFTMCQDLEPSFEGDTFVLTASNEVIYRSLCREAHHKSVAAALESIGITDFAIRCKSAREDRTDEDIERLKRNFSGTDIQEK